MNARRLALALLVFFAPVTVKADWAAIPPMALSSPTDDTLNYGDGYGSVRFNITELDVRSQQYWLGTLVRQIFGVQDTGEYLIALELLDPSGNGDEKLVARKIIAHFVKNPQGLLITDILPFLKSDPSSKQMVRDASVIVFSGRLSGRVPINQSTNNYSIALQIYRSNSASLTNTSIIDSAVDVINSASAAMKFSPITTAEKALYGQLRQFGFNIYQTFATNAVLAVSETRMAFIAKNSQNAPNSVRFSFPFLFDRQTGASVCQQGSKCFKNQVDVRVSFDVFRSEIGNLKSGKFLPPLNWWQWLAQANVGTQNIMQFLASDADTRDFVAALQAGSARTNTYAASNDIASACDRVVASISKNQFFSAPDTAAIYWAFLNQFWPQISAIPHGPACQAKYQMVFFEAYGLPPLSPTPVAAGPEIPSVLVPATPGRPITSGDLDPSKSDGFRDFLGLSTSEIASPRP